LLYRRRATVSIAIIIGGAVRNAAAFTGDNYLAKYLTGGSGKVALGEKTRHDKALETYQADMAIYTRDRTKLLNWIETNREIKELAKQNFTNTDYAFKLRNQAHPDRLITPPKNLNFLTFIDPVSCRNKTSCSLWAVAPSLTVMQLFFFFELFGVLL